MAVRWLKWWAWKQQCSLSKRTSYVNIYIYIYHSYHFYNRYLIMHWHACCCTRHSTVLLEYIDLFLSQSHCIQKYKNSWICQYINRLNCQGFLTLTQNDTEVDISMISLTTMDYTASYRIIIKCTQRNVPFRNLYREPDCSVPLIIYEQVYKTIYQAKIDSWIYY